MTTATVWKKEYSVIDEKGYAVEYFDDKQDAIEDAKRRIGASISGATYRVEEVTHYHTDRRIVWPEQNCPPE